MVRFIKAAVFFMLSATLLSACATRPRVPASAASRAFVIERDLTGASVARGEFRAINGTRRGFTAHLNGAFDGTTLTLVEDFVFDDGETDRKTWRLTRTGPGQYTGTREDVIGEAVGFQDGAVFRLEYDLRLPSANGRGMKVRFRDVMALNADGQVLNDATVGWFGLRVATVSLVITPESGGTAAASQLSLAE
jgi:hypothetical protein